MASNNRKRCPNCGALNAANASNCVICGTRLGRQRHSDKTSKVERFSELDLNEAMLGEDDLLARSAFSTPIGIIIALIVLGLVGGVLFVAASLLMGESEDSARQGNMLVDTPTASPSTPPPTAFPTNTRSAPPSFPTVTPLPSTPTPTETQGPCVKTARSEDTLYGLAQQCGHRDYTIVDVILTENPSLSCETCLQIGQTINIPWPTPTLDPNAATQSDTSSAIGGETQNRVAAPDDDGTPVGLATFFVEPTLRPGLQWHTVSGDENMIIIAQIYGADAKVLSDINPEIDFAQCDFSSRYGGETCTVLLYPGQRIRVPAPTPTPTLSPTLSGSETPTPSYTPTFNVPAAFSPPEDAAFDANSLVTLRWSSSGSLGLNEIYVIRIKNVDTDETFEGTSQDLFFVVPEAWQPSAKELQTFEWTVAIGTLNGEFIVSVRETTTPRTFQWQGR